MARPDSMTERYLKSTGMPESTRMGSMWEPPAGALEGQQAAAVSEGPDEQFFFHPLTNPDALQGKRGAGKVQAGLNAGVKPVGEGCPLHEGWRYAEGGGG